MSGLVQTIWLSINLCEEIELEVIMFFKKKTEKKTYDKSSKKPVIKTSICNGEQVAGFKDINTGSFEEVMLIKNPDDLASFKEMYDITEKIEKIY